jgi:hypothetical protein
VAKGTARLCPLGKPTCDMPIGLPSLGPQEPLPRMHALLVWFTPYVAQQGMPGSSSSTGTLLMTVCRYHEAQRQATDGEDALIMHP